MQPTKMGGQQMTELAHYLAIAGFSLWGGALVEFANVNERTVPWRSVLRMFLWSGVCVLLFYAADVCGLGI